MTIGATLLGLAWIAGCGPAAEETATQATTDAAKTPADTDPKPAEDQREAEQTNPFQSIQLGAGGSNPDGSGGDAGGASQSAEQRIAASLEGLKPLQIMLGNWRGITRREFENFKSVSEAQWVFDLTTDPEHPALIMESDENPYLPKVRITFDPQERTYRMQLDDAEGHQRIFAGRFTEEVRNELDDSDKPQRTYKLEFTQTEKAEAPDRWQLVFNQQRNDRFLLQLARARGNATAFRAHDVIAYQREGTSFAVSDTDYGDKECIISQGLGTSQVSYKGQTFWVCCSGCASAFNDDPETWIARYEKRKQDAEKK